MILLENPFYSTIIELACSGGESFVFKHPRPLDYTYIYTKQKSILKTIW